jgi:hypothetical protein
LINKTQSLRTKLLGQAACLLFGIVGCRVVPADAELFWNVQQASPSIVDPIGGSRIIIEGSGFLGTEQHPAVSRVLLSDTPVEFVILSDTQIQVLTPALPTGALLDLVLQRGIESRTLPNALEVWSPADLSGVTLFDAASGVSLGEAQTSYEWQRLTPEIHPDWRVRDGNTLTWLPSTNKFWMIAGWNGYQEPVGFSTVPEGVAYPPENTTDEVWSSPDGVTWSLERTHNSGTFERRHTHNTILWTDSLWVIGGDTHQGYYNHDVLRSADGINWTEVVAPGEPPWEPRALQVSGLYQVALWTGGGQSLLGPEEEYVYHNDLWRSEDGINWTQVVADAPGSDTRWAGCGMVESFVEFQGRMWLVGCARYKEVTGHELSNEVWSTTDGVTWQKHATPPWTGKGWQNVVVWDNKLWVLFGYTYGDPVNGWAQGNSNEVWYSEDGETWKSLQPDAPVPGSHAQGVAVHEDFLLYAGGNYSFGFGDGEDKSSWRLVPFRGAAVNSWTSRGSTPITVSASDSARPTLVSDSFGGGTQGLQFDGSLNVLGIDSPVRQPDGRTVLWIARAPYLPSPYGWEEVGAPVGTVLGGPADFGLPVSSVGFSDGQLIVHTMSPEFGPNGEFLWDRFAAGDSLQEGPGQIRMVGITHASDGTITSWIDGQASDSASISYAGAWSEIGGSMPGPYYGPNTRFAGTLGALVILDTVADPSTIEKIHQWAIGRFGAP